MRWLGKHQLNGRECSEPRELVTDRACVLTVNEIAKSGPATERPSLQD